MIRLCSRPELRTSGALPPFPPGIFMADIRTSSQLPLPFTHHIQIKGITAPELRHKPLIGRDNCTRTSA
jgi:hypothetical protein